MLQNQFSSHQKTSLFSIIVLLFLVKQTSGINCYECTSSQGADCVYTATSCQYGFFGCVKIAVLSGGVDKMGMFTERDRSIISMIRGCAILPFGGVDMCEQTSLFGTRVLKCTCFNDYCNRAPSRFPTTYFIFLAAYFLFG